MKYKSLMITAIVCTSVGFAALAQTRSGEGLSRQVISLKNMMENSATILRNRLTTVENDLTTVQGDLTTVQGELATTRNELAAARNQINTLTQKENQRRACNTRSGNTSIYWPEHADANGSGCVSHNDLGNGSNTNTTTTTGRACQGKRVSWTGGGVTCSGSIGSTPDQLRVTVRKSIPQSNCNNRDTSGPVGYATYVCRNGTFQLVSKSCEYRRDTTSHGECR